jgi:hypothetical protein
VISGYRAGSHRLHQPLGHEPLGELALRIFIIENRPALSGIERAL